MQANTPAATPAKISCPDPGNAVLRQRLHHRLEAAWTKPILWISSPAGSGKTTLVSTYLRGRKGSSLWYQCDQGDADLPTFFYYLAMAARKVNPRADHLPFLTPEYLLGIPLFSKRFFEELAAHCFPERSQGVRHAGGVIVFDNYQDIPANTPFHDMLALGLEALPAHVRTVIISRHEPPRQFERQRVNRAMDFLGWQDLQCTLEETEAIVRAQQGDASPGVVADLYEKTDGLLAFLILMLGRTKRHESPSPVADIQTSETLFDYFDREIFRRERERERAFLLATSFLPEVSIAHAEALTGRTDAGRFLSVLHRRHFFTGKLAGKGMGYRYHPLFRDFLQLKAAAEFSPDEVTRIRREAAHLLEQAERVEDAGRLYRDAADVQGLSLMVIRHAGDLLRQGRHEIVKEWLAAIPAGIAEATPWLMYWTALCSFPFDMPRTRNWFGKALEGFRAAGDAAGAYLAWAGIVDTHVLQLDDWRSLDDIVAIYADLTNEHPSFPSPEIELTASSRMLLALTVIRTDQPDLVQGWLERVNALLLERPALDIRVDTAFNLCVYHMWKGEYNKVGLLLERLDAELHRYAPHPFTEIRLRFMRGDYFLVTGQLDAAQRNFAEGLTISGESGVHLVDFFLYNFRAAASLAAGDMGAAQQALRRNTEVLPYATKLDRYFYHIYSAWYEALCANTARAAGHLEEIHTLTEEMGTPYYRSFWRLCMAHVVFLQGRSEEAKALVRDSLLISRNMKSFVLEWFGLLTNAYILLNEGNEREGLEFLRSGMALGRVYDYSHLEFCLPSFMCLVCVKALEHSIEPEYAASLITKCKLTPLDARAHSCDAASTARLAAVWPYSIRIRTLGRFEIVKDGKPLTFAGKPPKKALELLKALIAFGGRDVTVDRLADVLRPESDGDKAYGSIKVDLHNLRRLLGDNAIVTSQGKISLSFEHCCVDMDLFLRLAEDVMTAAPSRGGGDVNAPPAAAEKALELYRGNFLEDEECFPHYAGPRERLRNRFVRLVDTMGEWYEAGGEWRRAVELYEKGLHHDQQQEQFHNGLIRCYEQLGESREAAHVRERWRKRSQV
jgi:LuxR family maltose regulon positive regulatory protein